MIYIGEGRRREIASFFSCQYALNPCLNVTCSNNGYCFTNDTTTSKTGNSTKLAQCKCYADYEGEQCEIEKKWAKFIKYVIKPLKK